MMRTGIPVLLIASLLHFAAPALDTNNAEWTATLQDVAHDLNFPGVVLIANGNTVVFNQAFSTPEFPVTADTRYWIASISKSFTAVLIFRLQEEGLLSLQDKLGKFFPEAPPDKREITIAQLLTHTAGFANKYASEGIADRSEAAKQILALPLVHAPGQAFDYSNDGYSLLGIVASIVAHADYPDLISSKIFAPAGMASSGFWPGCGGPKPVLPLTDKPPAAMQRPNWGYKGPDGICSTTSDLALFMQALTQRRILKSETIEQMWTPAIAVSVGSAASGWFRGVSPHGTEFILTRGTDHGHNSIIKYYPKKDLTIIALSSSKDPDGPLLARQLVDRLELRLAL